MSAQSNAFRQFKSLSCPEKSWVIFHPFKAKKAQRITKEVQLFVDSVKQIGIIGVDNNGGKLDAFKHAFWMARLTKAIGARRTRKLGRAHEKGNYIQFKKHELEDSALPDSISSEMDLRNNEIGISRAKQIAVGSLSASLLKLAEEGCLFTIKKDENGNFLNCDGSILSIKDWYGKWNIPKCLVSPSCH
jgi:hypothetical protein